MTCRKLTHSLTTVLTICIIMMTPRIALLVFVSFAVGFLLPAYQTLSGPDHNLEKLQVCSEEKPAVGNCTVIKPSPGECMSKCRYSYNIQRKS